MKKNSGWVKSVTICLAVGLVMLGAGFYHFAGEPQAIQAGSIVEAAFEEQTAVEKTENQAAEETSDPEESEAGEKAVTSEPAPAKSATDQGTTEQKKTTAPGEEPVVTASANSTTNTPVDHKAEHETEKETVSKPVETVTEQPAVEPAPAPEPVETTSQPVAEPVPAVSAPVTYRWGSAANYTFRMEVKVTNNGSDPSRNVNVSVPLLENRSPYQTTALKSVNYNVVSTSGRVSTFNLGDMAPGETKTIVADFDIRVLPVSINSTNETVEKARQAYNQYAGSGNCRTLALGFIGKAREMGVEAREVVGFARPQRGAMTSGSLAGARHSWAEFYVDGLGWVPVDLTFQYFGEFPNTSHIVESYGDQSITVNYSGGSLSASWSNLIL